MNLPGMGRNILWFALGLAIAAAVLIAVRPAVSSDPVMIRSYEVRPEIAAEMRSALITALSANKEGSMRQVSLLPNGQLLVSAPPSLHADVKRILADVAARQVPATPAIHFEAWLIAAVPGEASASPALADVQPALAEIQKTKGPLRFELLEKLSTQARSGNSSEVHGEHATLNVFPTVRRGEKDEPVVNAVFQIRFHKAPSDWHERNVKAQAELRPGELLVAGQSALAGKAAAGSVATDRQVYYIVRAML